MANEFIARNGLIALNNSQITGSLNVSAGITGSLLGTASYATQALSASFASTASFVNVISTVNNTDYYLVGVSSSNGTPIPEQLYTFGPTFNPDTNTLNVPGDISVSNNVSAASFLGPLTGLASTAMTASYVLQAVSSSFASTATSANTASKITVTNIDTTNATYYPVFVDAQTGAKQAATDSGFTFNSFTNALTLQAGSLTAASVSLTGNITATGGLIGTASYATAASQSGYTMQFVLATTGSNPAANTIYVMGAPQQNRLLTSLSTGNTRVYVPRPGRVKSAFVYVRTNGTLASAATSSFNITKNGSTSEVFNTSTTAGVSTNAAISSSAVSMSVVAGDYMEVRWTTPAVWGTLPTAVEANAIIYIENNL